jgi:transposase
MSLPKDRLQSSLFQVGTVAAGLFQRGRQRRYLLLREHVMPALEEERERLEGMYCAENGRPAVDPVLLAKVTLLQYLERLPDRQAAEAVVLNLGWKLALGLEVEDEGFHPTTLVAFRNRLVEAELIDVLFGAVLTALREAGLVRGHSKQRLDSTHIVGVVAWMSRLQCVRETLRLTLQRLAGYAVEGEEVAWDVVRERYCETKLDWKEQDKETLHQKLVQAGEDTHQLLQWWDRQTGEWPEKVTAQWALLRRVFGEQFEVVDGAVEARDKTLSGNVINPHDADAQWSTKDSDKKTQWIGFKAQVAESVPEDPTPKPKGEPTEQFVTEMTTTEATASDIDGMGRLLEAQEGRQGERPSEIIVDSGYISDDTLHEAQEEGRELLGPARPSPDHHHGFPSEEFDVDIANRKAICPAGKTNTQCSHIRESSGKESFRFEWSYHCDDCPLKKDCTESKSGRRQLTVGIYHDLLQARRREMETDEFKQRMRQRAAVEGTHSEMKRMYGFGRSRYRGLTKTALANYCIGAACNASRWVRRILWETDQEALKPAPA